MKKTEKELKISKLNNEYSIIKETISHLEQLEHSLIVERNVKQSTDRILIAKICNDNIAKKHDLIIRLNEIDYELALLNNF